MCRTRVRSVVDAATLCVALIAAAAVAAASSEFSDHFYSGSKIFISDPRSAPQNFWSRSTVRGKRQKFNDPSFGVVPTTRGYRQTYGGPWVMVKHSPQKVARLTKQSPSQTPYIRSNADDKAMKRNFGGYARRSASEMSPAEEEYQAVRRALARDRVQPMRRSMVPTMGMKPKAGKKRKDKTVDELLPLTKKLASLIDKLDSRNGAVKSDGENGMETTKQCVIFLLKSLIDGLQKDVERKAENLRVRPKKVKEILGEFTRRSYVDDSIRKLNHPDNGALIGVDHAKSGTKNESPSFTEWLKSLRASERNQNDPKRVSQVVKAPSTSSMTVPAIENSNTTDKHGQAEYETGLNDSNSKPPARRFMNAMNMSGRNTGAVVHSLFDTPTGLIPEHRAFDSFAVEGHKVTKDADTSVELVNRAFDEVTPKRSKNIASRTGLA